jgi:hypothetical protein
MLTVFKSAGLPAVATLATSLRSIATDVGAAGVVILKMDKTGHWVYGADQTEAEDDATVGHQSFLVCPRLYCLG